MDKEVMAFDKSDDMVIDRLLALARKRGIKTFKVNCPEDIKSFYYNNGKHKYICINKEVTQTSNELARCLGYAVLCKIRINCLIETLQYSIQDKIDRFAARLLNRLNKLQYN